MGGGEVSTFVEWLAVRQRISASTRNQALSALVFPYGQVLGLDLGPIEHTPRARMPDKLPVVLSREEIGQLMKHVEGVIWLIVALLYGAGLRLEECLELRVKDLDFDRGQIIETGFGRARRKPRSQPRRRFFRRHSRSEWANGASLACGRPCRVRLAVAVAANRVRNVSPTDTCQAVKPAGVWSQDAWLSLSVVGCRRRSYSHGSSQHKLRAGPSRAC